MTSPYNSGDPNFQQHDSIFGPPQQQPGGPGPMPQQPQPAMNAGMPQHVQQVVNVNLTAAQVQGMAGAEPVQHVKSFGVYMMCRLLVGILAHTTTTPAILAEGCCTPAPSVCLCSAGWVIW